MTHKNPPQCITARQQMTAFWVYMLIEGYWLKPSICPPKLTLAFSCCKSWSPGKKQACTCDHMENVTGFCGHFQDSPRSQTLQADIHSENYEQECVSLLDKNPFFSKVIVLVLLEHKLGFILYYLQFCFLGPFTGLYNSPNYLISGNFPHSLDKCYLWPGPAPLQSLPQPSLSLWICREQGLCTSGMKPVTTVCGHVTLPDWHPT